MAEIFPDVYDIVHPTPVSLKELATMAISIEINKFAGISMNAVYSSKIRRLMKPILPDLPSAIMNVIEEHVIQFTRSLDKWLRAHHDAVFRFHRDCETSILKEFDNFVCDFNGSVHYEKTAQRMMQSDRLSEPVKFKIACMYFFEEDIRRIWPSVCENSDLNEIDFDKSPELCYWVCRFRNELDKIPIERENDSVDEAMFYQCIGNIGNRRMVLYLWNRIPLESRMRLAIQMSYSNRKSFARFILPKLDDKELVEFVDAKGVELMHDFLEGNSEYDVAYILPTWMYIKNVMMNLDAIKKLIVDMLRTEAYHRRKVENWAYFCLEILHHVPRDLKLSIIRSILSNNSEELVESARYGSRSWRDVDFLLGILSCVTFQERNVFWRNQWHNLIRNTRCKNLRRIMEICFENEDEIAQFKENVMARSEEFRDNCISLLSSGPDFDDFDELNELLGFCYPDDPTVETAKRFKQQVLRSVLLGEGVRISKFINGAVELNKLIDDAFQNIDLAADFINQFMSPLVVQEELSSVVCGVEFNEFYPVGFLEIIVSRCSESICQQIKTRIMNDINATLVPNSAIMIYLFTKCNFVSILSWCLGGIEEVWKFRKMCFSK